MSDIKPPPMQVVRSGPSRAEMVFFLLIVACVALAPILLALRWLLGQHLAAFFGWTAC